MKSEAELKKSVAEFKKGMVDLEKYRKDSFVPIMRYRHVYKFCFVIFTIYIVLWGIFMLLMSKPIFAPLMQSDIGHYLTMWSMLHMTTFAFVTPISGVLMLFCFGKHFHRIHDYQELAKEIYVTTLMEFCFQEVEYRPGRKIPEKITETFLSFMPRHTKKKFEEHVECELDGNKVHFINAELIKKTDEAKLVVFNGLVMECDLKESMHFETYIVPKRKKRYNGLYKIQFESDFGQVFDVYSNEHVLAKKYINEILGAKLMKLVSHMNGCPYCAMIKNKLYMTLPLGYDAYGLSEKVENEIKISDTKPIVSVLKDVADIIEIMRPYKESNV